MVFTGRVRYENLSAVRVADDGSVDYGVPPVRFGDTVVPARAAYIIEGTHSSPSLRIEFEIRGGKPFCVAVHIEASSRGRGVQSGDLTTIPNLARLAEDVFVQLATKAPGEAPPTDLGADIERSIIEKVNAAYAPQWDPAARRVAKADVQTRGDEELREVARVYRENVNDRPVEAVEGLGFSRRTASRRIQQAREKGYLPATTQGKRKA